MSHHSLIILGSGPAGLTAAVYAARANLNPTVITGNEIGGQLMLTTDVENWPGDAKDLQGPALMERMLEHAKHLNVNIIQDHIVTLDLSSRPFTLKGQSSEYTTDALIVSTGASAKWLGLDSEKEYNGKGVSACATCDGFFFKDQNVCVVGGGNTAVEEALYLSRIAKHVTVIHRRDKLRAEKTLQSRLFKKEEEGKVSIIWDHEVIEILGNKNTVTHLKLKSTKDNSEQEIETDGLFVAIGHTPNTQLFEGQLEMEQGYIKVNAGQKANATETSVKGVYAAGDVMDSVYRQAITSAGSGCMAALDAESYLEELESK